MFLVNNTVTISLLVLLILGDMYKDKEHDMYKDKEHKIKGGKGGLLQGATFDPLDIGPLVKLVERRQQRNKLESPITNKIKSNLLEANSS
jgi:hypothetical protein